MLCCAPDYWGGESYFFPSSDILNNIRFRKLGLFPSSREGVGDTYSVGSLTKRSREWRLALSNGPNSCPHPLI
jgi:hypothetical protein